MSEEGSEGRLLEQIQAASPEEIAEMLLAGGQRFLRMGLEAVERKDAAEQVRCINRVADIILELRSRLNLKDGGEAAQNLAKIYDWWTSEIFRGLQDGDVDALRRVAGQMGEFQETWAQVRLKGSGA